MSAIGYVRQSRRADLDVALSRDAQLAAIRRLCEGCEVLEDMGRSGKAGGERLRPGYQRLVEGVESGEFTDVYAIALSRFSRSVPELHALMELAKARGVRIVTAKEGVMDPHTATGRMIFNTWANFAEFVRDMAVEAANENVAVRRSRGERMGTIPYGERPGDDALDVVTAFQEAASLNGAAALLNDRQIASYRGRLWSGVAVRNVIARARPDLLPRRAERGVKPSSPFLLYRLLRCPCGGTLTASRDGRGDRDVVYRCHAAEANRAHPRPYRVREATVLPWIRAEAARFRPDWMVERSAAGEAERARLEDQRAAVADAVIIRALSAEQGAARVAQIEAELDAIDDQVAVSAVPTIDWSTWATAEVAKVLRTYWRSIELDAAMTPVRADWRFGPEFLSPA